MQYGALPQQLYTEMGKVGADQGREINSQNMLVTGWMSPTRDHLVHEIVAEEKQRGFLLGESSFAVDPRLKPCLSEVSVPEYRRQKLINCSSLQLYSQFQILEGSNSTRETLQERALTTAICGSSKFSKKELNEEDVELASEGINARRIVIALWMKCASPKYGGYFVLAEVILTMLFRIVTPLIVVDRFRSLSDLGSSPVDLVSRIFIMIVGGHLQLSLLAFLMVRSPQCRGLGLN